MIKSTGLDVLLITHLKWKFNVATNYPDVSGQGAEYSCPVHNKGNKNTSLKSGIK